MSSRFSTRPAIPWLAALLTALAMAAGLAVHAAAADAAAQTPEKTPAVPGASAARGAEEVPAVEDGAYPDADQIEQNRGITLISGNGLLTLTDCGADGLIQVRSNTQGLICFKARTWPDTDAIVTVKIPEAYLIKGDEHEVKAKLTTEQGQTKTYDITKNEWTPVGEGSDPDIPPETLIELRAKA